jgi:hypothetical protein
LIDKKADVENFQAKIKGATFDLDYSIDAVAKMANTDKTFEVY